MAASAPPAKLALVPLQKSTSNDSRRMRAERRNRAREARLTLETARTILRAIGASKSERTIGRSLGSTRFSTKSGSMVSSSATPPLRRRSATTPSCGTTTERCTRAGSRFLSSENSVWPGPPLREVSLRKRTRSLGADSGNMELCLARAALDQDGLGGPLGKLRQAVGDGLPRRLVGNPGVRLGLFGERRIEASQ